MLLCLYAVSHITSVEGFSMPSAGPEKKTNLGKPCRHQPSFFMVVGLEWDRLITDNLKYSKPMLVMSQNWNNSGDKPKCKQFRHYLSTLFTCWLNFPLNPHHHTWYIILDILYKASLTRSGPFVSGLIFSSIEKKKLFYSFVFVKDFCFIFVR